MDQLSITSSAYVAHSSWLSWIRLSDILIAAFHDFRFTSPDGKP